MGISWLLQGLLTELLGQAIGRSLWLAVLAGGVIFVLLAYLAAKDSRWARPILYGFVGAAAVIVIFIGVLSLNVLSKQPPNTTPATLRMNIGPWLNRFKLNVQWEKETASEFAVVVTLPNSYKVRVKITQEIEHYLIFESDYRIPPDSQVIFNKLPDEEQRRLIDELILEVAKLKIEWMIHPLPITSIDLRKLVPITNSLTEAAFMEYLNEMGSALVIINTRLRIKR